MKEQRSVGPDILSKFDASCIARLACIGKVPKHVEVAKFGDMVRSAIRMWWEEQCEPTGNQLRREIKALCDGVETALGLTPRIKGLPPRSQRARHHVAVLRQNLSPATCEYLERRGTHPVRLPSSDMLRDPDQWEDACKIIGSLCSTGGHFDDRGKKRRSGKRSRRWVTELRAPKARTTFPKRQAERVMTMSLWHGWLRLVGEEPPRTANGRELGPFGRMLRECLIIVEAIKPDGGHHVVADLINELGRQYDQLWKKGMSANNP